METKKKILVVGATGKQGKGFVKHFCQLVKPQDNFKLKCLSRDTHSEQCNSLLECDDSGVMVECARGDLRELLDRNKYEHFAELACDCTGMFIVLRTGENETEIGKKLIDMASKVGIQHIVYSSVANADLASGIPEFEPKKQIQDYLLAHQSGIDTWTIIRPTCFYQNFLEGSVQKRIEEESILEFPLPPGTKLQMVDCEDVGELACNAFLAPQEFHNKIIDFVSSEMTMAQYASILNCQYVEKRLDSMTDSDVYKKFQWLQKEGFHGRIDYSEELLPSLTTFQNWALQNHLLPSEQYQKKIESKKTAEARLGQLPAGSAV